MSRFLLEPERATPQGGATHREGGRQGAIVPRVSISLSSIPRALREVAPYIWSTIVQLSADGTFFFLFFFFLLFRVKPVAYGGSQARGLNGAVGASLHHSHSNAGSEPHL